MCACEHVPGWTSHMRNSEDKFWECSRLPPCWGGSSLCCCAVLQARCLFGLHLSSHSRCVQSTDVTTACGFLCVFQKWNLGAQICVAGVSSQEPSAWPHCAAPFKSMCVGSRDFQQPPPNEFQQTFSFWPDPSRKGHGSSRPDCFSWEHSPLCFLSLSTKTMAPLAPATLLSLVSTSRKPPLSVSPSRYVRPIINNSSEGCVCSELLGELPKLAYIDLFFTSMHVLKGSCSLLFGTTKLCLESQIKISNSHLIFKNRHFIILREEPI